MTPAEKKTLSERDICTKFITPALVKAGWDVQTQIREEVLLTRGKVIVSGKVHRRGEAKRAEYLLHFKPNLALALIEAKDNIPPLAEQKRIVARVEALLRQCDALGAQLHQTRTLGAHLLDSTLHHLLAA